MARQLLVRGMSLGAAVAVLLAGCATPATRSRARCAAGRRPTGKPVAGADVTIDFVGDKKVTFTAKTDKKGEWIQAGLPSAPSAGGTSRSTRAT